MNSHYLLMFVTTVDHQIFSYHTLLSTTLQYFHYSDYGKIPSSVRDKAATNYAEVQVSHRDENIQIAPKLSDNWNKFWRRAAADGWVRVLAAVLKYSELEAEFGSTIVTSSSYKAKSVPDKSSVQLDFCYDHQLWLRVLWYRLICEYDFAFIFLRL